MKAVKQLADSLALPVHLDGARVFNAAAALGVDVRAVAANFTSIQFCLSKVSDQSGERRQLACSGPDCIGICLRSSPAAYRPVLYNMHGA